MGQWGRPGRRSYAGGNPRRGTGNQAQGDGSHSQAPRAHLRRPFIEYQMCLFRKQGIIDLVLCVGYPGHLVEKHLADGRESVFPSDIGTEQDRLLVRPAPLKQAEDLLETSFSSSTATATYQLPGMQTMNSLNVHSRRREEVSDEERLV